MSSFEILKGLSPPDVFSSSNAEIISSTFLGVTGRHEKGLIEMYLPLILFYTRVVFELINNTLIGSDSFNDLHESDHLNNLRNDIMD